MKTKIEIKCILGKLLFEYKSEGNTLANTICEANLRGVDLRKADLREANLRGVDLRKADLRGADLYGANLRGADLCGADLYEANLYRANLYGANLYGANLRGADLCGADLYGANLYGANLCGANLYGANLYGANLTIFNKWSYSVNLEKKKITIGCKTKDIENWDIFFASKEEYLTSRSSEEFKFIEATYLAAKAYMTHLLKAQ